MARGGRKQWHEGSERWVMEQGIGQETREGGHRVVSLGYVTVVLLVIFGGL